MDRDLALARRLKECLVFLSWSDEIGEVVIFDDPDSSKVVNRAPSGDDAVRARGGSRRRRRRLQL